MSESDSEVIANLKFKRARFLDQIIAVNPNRKRIVMKNLAKDEKSHMTFTVLGNGELDMHIKNEVTEQYQPISIPLFMRFLSLAFRDFGNFIEQFDPSQGRFARLPAVLIKPPMFELVMKGRELIMNVKETNILLGSVSQITEADIIMGYVDDWKRGEQYMLFRKNNHSYRIPMFAFAKDVIKCLRESVEFTDTEKAFMKLEEYDGLEAIPARIVRNAKRVFYFIQPLYYRLVAVLYPTI